MAIAQNLGSHVITAFQSAGTWQRGEIYAGGWHLGTYYPNATYFSFTDWLGTEHLRTDNLGNLYQTCYNLPFGDGQTCAGTDVSPLHFTGKERDSESGLDYFGARYYASTMGRFTTPDWAAKATAVPYANFGDPQTLNLYGYVRNSPLSKADPDGHVAGVDDAAIVTAAVVTYGVLVTYYVLTQPQTQHALSDASSAAVGAITSLFQSKKQQNPTGPSQPQSNPWQGNPGDTAHTTHPDGTPKQDRKYGPDGYPETDVDHGHDHGQGDPHAHDIGRPSDGSPPTADDRSPGRPVQPTDPQPQQQQQPQQPQQPQPEQHKPEPQ